MSQVKVQGNASGSGDVYLQSPNTNTDRTLTLPDDTGTLVYANASGNVGIGTTSPSQKLHIDSGGLQVTPSTGENVVLTRDSAGPYFGTSSNHNMRLITNNSECLRIQSGGKVIIPIAGSLPSTLGALSLKVDGGEMVGISMQKSDADNLGAMRYYNSSGTEAGSIVVTETATSYNTSSDYRLKENVVPMSANIDRLKQLKPCNFNFIADATTTVDGFLAHEAQAVIPEAVTGVKDAMMSVPVLDAEGNDTGEVQQVPDYQGIDQSKLVPLLTAALQEAVAKIEALETRVTQLETP